MDIAQPFKSPCFSAAAAKVLMAAVVVVVVLVVVLVGGGWEAACSSLSLIFRLRSFSPPESRLPPLAPHFFFFAGAVASAWAVLGVTAGAAAAASGVVAASGAIFAGAAISAAAAPSASFRMNVLAAQLLPRLSPAPLPAVRLGLLPCVLAAAPVHIGAVLTALAAPSALCRSHGSASASGTPPLANRDSQISARS